MRKEAKGFDDGVFKFKEPDSKKGMEEWNEMKNIKTYLNGEKRWQF